MALHRGLADAPESWKPTVIRDGSRDENEFWGFVLGRTRDFERDHLRNPFLQSVPAAPVVSENLSDCYAAARS